MIFLARNYSDQKTDHPNHRPSVKMKSQKNNAFELQYFSAPHQNPLIVNRGSYLFFNCMAVQFKQLHSFVS